MYIKLGAFDAKAKLSTLLQEVKHDRNYAITIHRKPVPDLVTSEHTSHANIQVAIDEMRNICKVKRVSPQSLMTWITEGQR
ncbi:MAG: prevent-host-death family protein [Gammaproteobacteria bacterium]|jgi:antitoxin (DNA-binding transcriptional repressor) of toxin-antitoxin stability system|nr:prevent-host-death family protein [Gammaproteobacteria bacterium]